MAERPALPGASGAGGDSPKPPRRAHVSKQGLSRPPHGGLTLAQRAITPAEEVAFAQLETELGGRPALIASLTAAHLTQDMDALLGLIADPAHDHESLGQICALARVKVSGLLGVLRESAMVKGRVLAAQRIADRLPDVAAAVMEDATPGIKVCPQCLGARWVPKPTNDDPNGSAECPNCRGIGDVMHQPEHEVQRTALKIGGLLDTGKGGAGMNLNILQANTQILPGATATYDTFVGMLDQVVYGSGRDRLRSMSGRTVQREFVEGEKIEGDPADPAADADDTPTTSGGGE